jgi:pilus assembly protein Flp/PilA
MFNGLISLVQALTAKVALRDESGQALIEYGLLVGLIAVLCVAAVTLLGGTIQGYFNAINAAL